MGQEQWEQPAECRYPLKCIGGGMWVVKQFETKSDNLTSSVRKFFYNEGRWTPCAVGSASRKSTKPM